MLEARSGRMDIARHICKFLMARVPSHGPVYSEALRLDERNSHLNDALDIAERCVVESMVNGADPHTGACKRCQDTVRYGLAQCDYERSLVLRL